MSTPPRVLYVLPGLWRGGAERRLVTLAAGLMARGATVRVATMMMPRGDAPNVADELAALGVTIDDLGWVGVRSPLKLWKSARSGRRLARLVREFAPDVVHAMLPAANIIAAEYAGARRRRHTLILGREGLPTYRATRPLLGWLEDRASRRADVVLCVADAIVRAIREGPRAPWYGRLETIHNGIDVDAFAATDESRRAARADLEARFPAARGTRVGVVVSNLNVYKGHRDIIAALALLARGAASPPLALVFVGADPVGERARLDALAASAGVSERLHFTGAQFSVRPFLHGADFYLSASHEEGLSLALLEAMAAGLPVVASDAGGTCEAAAPPFATLFPPRDIDALAAALREIATAPAADLVLRGAAAHAACRDRFSAARMVDLTDRLYRSLIAARRPGAPPDPTPR